LARGRKGGQRSGVSTVLTLANGAITSKEGKARMRKGDADVRGRREKENKRRRECDRHRWNERKSGIRGAPLRLPRLGHALGSPARVVSTRFGRNPKSFRNWDKEIPSINLISLLPIYRRPHQVEKLLYFRNICDLLIPHAIYFYFVSCIISFMLSIFFFFFP
jgi:hypothetical protein